MVRAGIALYGYYPSDESAHDIPLHPALELYSRIVRLHRIPTGGGVGYGHEFRCERETNIALVPLGYGDGLPRNLGNGRGGVLIRGRSAPIVGRVSMDQITVDVTEIPGVSTGDLVTLIGENEGASQTADDVATAAGTISYEILTRLMPRIPRLYCRGGRPVEMMDLSSAGMLHPVVEE
jgi:alanine racemase